MDKISRRENVTGFQEGLILGVFIDMFILALSFRMGEKRLCPTALSVLMALIQFDGGGQGVSEN